MGAMKLFATSKDNSNRAAIILAGGDGTRLAEVTRRHDGVHVQKQFCALTGGTSLLEQTRRRVASCVAPEQTLFALNRKHQDFFSPLLADVQRENLVIQPQNRGTAPAILYSLLRLAELAPAASVLLMPSDHHVGDEVALKRSIDLAFIEVEHRPETIVLLGVSPESAEIGYGWIEPAKVNDATRGAALPVRRFWEKPSHGTACELMRKGCLWNTFMIVGQLQALLGLFIFALPELYASFSKIRRVFGTDFEQDIVERFFHSLRSSDFSRQVLQSAPSSLSVLPVMNAEWSDLGEPHRLAKAVASVVARARETAA
jgi:mannose-1-phosphate guanylyltransferase